MDIDKIRDSIDQLDGQILSLLNQRAELALQIAQLKQQQGQEPFVPAREREVFDQMVAQNPGPLSKEAVIAIYREIIATMRALEKSLTVAYLGPPGTFSHLATLNKFGSLANHQPRDSISDVFGEVEAGRADYGVVPIENSTEGVEYHTLDRLAESSLQVSAEVYVDIEHHLLSKGDLDSIQRIYSHSQALSQCRTWLKTNLPNAELVEVASTARAAQLAAEDANCAAIGSRLASDLYQLNRVRERIEDYHYNRTRFLIIGTTQSPSSSKDKTSIMFSVKHEAGSLVRALGGLGKHDINMTMIESRPTRQTPWEYVFFIDFQGHAQDPQVAKALSQFKEQCLFLRVLGSYPEAE